MKNIIQIYHASCCSFTNLCLTVISWTAACLACLSVTIFQSLLKLISIESIMLSNQFILCCPLLILPSIFFSVRFYLYFYFIISILIFAYNYLLIFGYYIFIKENHYANQQIGEPMFYAILI